MKKKDLENIGVVFTKEESYDTVAKEFIRWEQSIILLQDDLVLEVIYEDKKLRFDLVHERIPIEVKIDSVVQFQYLVKALMS